MQSIELYCPACKRNDALGRSWLTGDGQEARTCHGLNRKEHLACCFHFYVLTGMKLTVADGVSAKIFAAMEVGQPVPLRGFPAEYLANYCGITVISAKNMDVIFAMVMPQLGSWAREIEQEGFLICQLPIHRGPLLVGLQFRAFRPCEDRTTDQHQIRVFGKSDGLFIPHYIGQNPSAVVIHEGPWGAVAAAHEASIYGNTDLFSVATISAGVSAVTIKSTLDAIFPGVPRFSVFDQDDAGIAARMATMGVAKPILINGAGPGKDYRDLIAEVRFERLVGIIERELKVIEART